MKTSRTVEYALHAVVQLAQHEPGTPVPCSKLAKTGQMPERFLLQILRSLVTHGILSSTRGVDGGYALERPPEQITLLEIIEAVDGPLGGAIGTFKGMADDSRTRLLQALNAAAAAARRELAAVKLAALVPAS